MCKLLSDVEAIYSEASYKLRIEASFFTMSVRALCLLVCVVVCCPQLSSAQSG